MPEKESSTSYTLSLDHLGVSANFGVLNHMEDATRYCRPYLKNKVLTGVEAFAIRPRFMFDWFLHRLENEEIPVASIHGRTHGNGYSRFDTLKLLAANATLLPTEVLAKHYNHIPLLIHHTEAMRRNVRLALATEKPDLVYIENHHTGTQALEETAQVTRGLLDDGVNARMLFDICHFIGAKQLTNEKHFRWHWHNALDDLEHLLRLRHEVNGEEIQLLGGIHFPIGDNREDSIPLHWLLDEDLERFAHIINGNGNIHHFVIENQPEGIIGMFILHPEERFDKLNFRLLRLALLGILPHPDRP